jgi:hypothetical protein
VNLFVIDFNEAAANEMIFMCLVFSDCDYLAEGSGNDALRFFAFIATHHCVSFAASRLSIGKNSSIVSI